MSLPDQRPTDLPTVLVTGGAGYVGAHACAALAANGYLPVVFDDLSRGSESRVQWGPLERGSILDPQRLRAVLEKYQPLAVMHFAGLSDSSESVRQPTRYHEVNVGGSQTLLDSMGESGVRKIIFSSSAAVYGPHEGLISETNVKTPASPYGQSKLAAESVIADWVRKGCGAGIALRYFNAAGSALNGQIGEYFDRPSHLIPRALLAARRDEVLEVYGSDWPTRDGSCIRDFIHVEDLARAHLLALEQAAADAGTFRAINLGSGTGHSVNDVVLAVGRQTGRPLRVRVKSRRPGDVAAVVADTALAHKLLGWEPENSTLTSIVESSWRWLDRYERMGNASASSSVTA